MHSLIRVLVGPEQREFVVHRAMLCASSPFFRDSIDAVPEGLSSPLPPPPRQQSVSPSPSPSPPSSPTAALSSSASHTTPAIWLTSESADVFELFVLWLYRRQAFRAVVDDAVTILAKKDDDEVEDRHVPELRPYDAPKDISVSANLSELHWHLVNLHLFAALVDIPALQDVVMDSLQDLYLRFDWTATPALLRFLYAEADPFAAFRLRKWAVPLLAWTLANAGVLSFSSSDDQTSSSSPAVDELLQMLQQTPTLWADYHAHLAKMQASRADVRIKNPQLRIASNVLRREDRHFGFRQCSFHSHRRAVGEGRCPHTRRVRTGSASMSSSSNTYHPHHHHHEVAASTKESMYTSSENASPSSSSSSPSSPPSRSSKSGHSHSHSRMSSVASWTPPPARSHAYVPLGMETTR